LAASHAPAALHASFAGQAPCAPSARSPHVVPPAHEAHGPAQAAAQQKSSPPEQLPLAQSLPLFDGMHAWPLTPSHAPAALHAWFAGHAPCAPSARSPHVAPPAHEAQGPAHAEAQQKSSPPEQLPLAQSLPLFDGMHAWPLAASHAPAALHAWFAGQVPVAPAASSPHVVPPAHFPQGPVQATSQQKLSPPEQNPLAQSLPLFDGLHGWPPVSSQEPAALHAWFAGHAPCDPSASSPQVAPPVQLAQGPVHAVAQQMLSPPEQKPLAHSLLPLPPSGAGQGAPLALPIKLSFPASTAVGLSLGFALSATVTWLSLPLSLLTFASPEVAASGSSVPPVLLPHAAEARATASAATSIVRGVCVDSAPSKRTMLLSLRLMTSSLSQSL
jgi:hypothetical protein